MGVISRILGICRTRPPADSSCWTIKDGKIEVEISKVPELKPKGGAIRLERSDLPLRILLFHGDDGQYHAVHNKCTHMGRRLDVLPGQTEIECCSVNKSRFTYDGGKLSGPAKGPVKAFPVEQSDGKLIVTLN